MRVFLVDDEHLALKRLSRLLRETNCAQIIGQETDSLIALEKLNHLDKTSLDAVFLDVQMPELNGFELLAKLNWQPLVVFATAYDQYALQAFEVNSIDYLLKPIEPEKLRRALSKLERFLETNQSAPDLQATIRQITDSWAKAKKDFPTRIASKIGDRVRFLELANISHFYAEDKLTFAAAANGNFIVDRTISQLERELNPQKFVRIHRTTLLNLDFVEEINSWFGGRLIVKIKDGKRTQLTVARDRVRDLKEKLGF
ncbi:MAG: LytTR family DNA-binding domain-containing protein [Acidobacteriota bacterium]|nr:LytTR family DNA-binding domain-containing protein [Acidobacteriota bacterium]